MLVNGTHLLPDPSGALVWPKQRMLVAADPLPGDERHAAAVVKRLGAVLRHRRPAAVVWLGSALAAAFVGGRLDRRTVEDLERMVSAHDWTWVAEDLPDGLPGGVTPELGFAPLTFRANARPDAAPGEIAAAPAPAATIRDGDKTMTCPCFLVDGRRLLLPPFGPQAGRTDALSPEVLALYRRPFHALLLLPSGRLLTRPRTALLPAATVRKPGRHD